MTLFREINSLLFGIFLLVMTSLLYFQFTQTRDFMSHQVESDLNNTMTSLGLMLKPHLETGDMVTAETLVNVIFEGGFYQKVTITWLADNKTQVWENPINIEEVPDWFIGLNLFKEQAKESTITSGWMQLATIKIQGHPGFAYKELWRVMNDTVMVLSLFFILSIFFLRFRLNRILQPLNDIASQAKQIAERKVVKDLALPKAIELKDVVIAINSMAGQLKQIFSTLDEEVKHLKEERFIDKTSALPNRQYLNAQLNNWLGEPGIGGLILAKFDWLDEIYSKYGYQGRDECIKALSGKMSAELPKISDSIIARIANNEFAFLLTNAEQHDIELYVQSLIRLVNQEVTKAGSIANEGFSIGISQRQNDMKASELMSQSDNALQQAFLAHKVSHWLDDQQPKKYNRQQWRDKLVRSIDDNQFNFQWQAIHQMKSDAVLHREIYCRLTIDDQLVSAREFMPFIELLALGSQLDRCLLTSMLRQDVFIKSAEPIAINLTKESIKDDDFTQWLAQFLTQCDFTERMLFELPESAVISHTSNCLKLVEILRASGVMFGIDQCGRQIGSLDYLQKMQPDYIKLDQSFTFSENSLQHEELCRALVNVAKGLKIDVIMTGIEDKEQLSQYSNVQADGYQGYISPVTDV